MKCSSAYNHLRLANPSPLLDPWHLRDLLRGIACKFDMNQSALDAIERKDRRTCDFNLMLGNNFLLIIIILIRLFLTIYFKTISCFG